MPNYTLVPGLQKYGTGSLQVPYRAGTTGSDANLFVINAQSGNNFTIQANQDFIISFWAKYGDFNPNTNTSVLRRLFGYGGLGGSWSFGITSRNIGGAQQMLAYFEYNGNVMTTVYNASQTNNLGPAANGDWCKWTASRSGSTITFSFYRPDGSSINTNTQIYSGTIGENFFNPPNSDPWTRIIVGPANYPDDGANNVVYIDEFYMARDISQPVNQNPQTLEVNDGKLNTTAFLYHFNNSYADITSLTQEFSANLSSAFSIQAQAREQSTVQAHLTSTSQLTANAARIKQFNVALTSQASVYCEPRTLDYFWANIVNITGYSIENTRAVEDSQRNVISVGYQTISGTSSIVRVYKYTNDGRTLTWQQAISHDFSVSGAQLVVDSQNNIYVATRGFNTSTSTIRGSLFKLNSSGAMQWSKTANAGAYNISIDSQDFIYTSLQAAAQTTYLNKFSSAGASTYAIRTTSGTLRSSSLTGLVIQTSGTNVRLNLLNTSGIVRQSEITIPNNTNFYVNGNTEDSQGNLYLVGSYFSSLTTPAFDPVGVLFKFDNTGNLLWSRKLRSNYYTSSLQVQEWSAVITATNQIIVSGAVSGQTQGIVFRFDSQGYLIYATTITNDSVSGVALNRAGNVLIGGSAGLTAKIPEDQSRLGVYDLVTLEDDTSRWITEDITFTSTANVSGNTWTTVATPFSAASLTSVTGTSTNQFQTLQIVRPSPATFTATSTFTATGSKITGLVKTNLTAASQLTANINRTRSFSSNLTASFTQTAGLTSIKRTGANITANATLTGQLVRRILGAANLTADFTATAQAKKYPGGKANLTANTTQQTSAIKTASAQAQIQTSASELTVISRIRNDLAIIDATTQLQAQATITARIVINMQSQTNISAQLNQRKQGYSTQFVSTSLAVEPTWLRQPQAFVTATVQMTTNATKAIITSADLHAATQLQAQTLRAKTSTTSSVMNVRSVMTTLATSLKSAEVNLAISASLFCSIFKVFRPTIHLYAGSFVMSVGRRIDIDPYTTLHIPQESRGIRILPESRIISIKEETRVNIIQGQER